MAGIRPEDANVKIPALIHLTRLGYRYLPRSGVHPDRETNILPEILRSALERINGIPLSDAVLSDLLEDIRRTLSRDDLGEGFLNGLRASWRGLRLIDFSHPENNAFHVMTELPYISGANRFRPDITLFVNGLPLSFIEVKGRSPRDGVRSEYDRMADRARNPGLRRFINETQIMVFSNDGEYSGNEFFPVQGAFYATSAYDDLIFHHFEEEELLLPSGPADPGEIALILRDTRLEALADTSAVRPDPETPTHRLLTSLFHIRRLLFFLRYGITFLAERDADGIRRVSKRILRRPPLFAVRLPDPALPGGRDIWYLRSADRVALAAVQIRYLADHFADRGIPVRFYFLADHPDRARLIREEFLKRGLRVIGISSGETFLRSVLREESWDSAPGPLVAVVCTRDFADRPLPFLPPGSSSARHVYFLDAAGSGYEIGESFLSRLRAADPEAILIALSPAED